MMKPNRPNVSKGGTYPPEFREPEFREPEFREEAVRYWLSNGQTLKASFWATLKTECFNNFHDGIPATRQEALQRIFRYIELFYNPQSLHSAFDYCSPIEVETKYFNQKEENLSLSVYT